MNKEYMFFFVGGSCGSFAKSIFHYYLNKLNNRRPIILNVDPLTGHCHDNNVGDQHHTHFIDQISSAKKIVVVDFDDDDKPVIARMAFHKVVKKQIADDPMFLEKQWGQRFSDVKHDLDLVEKILVDNPNYLIFSDWREQVKKINPVLTIKFKDIMFGDLNTNIAKFFQAEPLPEVDKFIQEYRHANQKYLNKN